AAAPAGSAEPRARPRAAAGAGARRRREAQPGGAARAPVGGFGRPRAADRRGRRDAARSRSDVAGVTPRRGPDRARDPVAIRAGDTRPGPSAGAADRAEPGLGAQPRLQHHAGRGHGRRVACGERHGGRASGAHPAGVRAGGRARGGDGAVSQDLTYEQALEKLDQQLKLLEDGDLSLEDALKAVDEARVYLKICTDRLEAAKRKIEVRPEE